jgi:hypothetical protein
VLLLRKADTCHCWYGSVWPFISVSAALCCFARGGYGGKRAGGLIVDHPRQSFRRLDEEANSFGVFSGHYSLNTAKIAPFTGYKTDSLRALRLGEKSSLPTPNRPSPSIGILPK